MSGCRTCGRPLDTTGSECSACRAIAAMRAPARPVAVMDGPLDLAGEYVAPPPLPKPKSDLGTRVAAALGGLVLMVETGWFCWLAIKTFRDMGPAPPEEQIGFMIGALAVFAGPCIAMVLLAKQLLHRAFRPRERRL